MTFINLEPSISPKLQELIQEANPSIHTAKEKILTAYNYAIENDGLRPKEAAKMLRKKLDFSASYIRKVLSLKAKDQSRVRPKQFSTKFAPTEAQNLAENDKNVVNIATAYDIQDTETISREYMVKDYEASNTTTAVGAKAETEIEDQSEQQQFIAIQETYIRQLEELEVTRQMLYSKIQQNRFLVNEIRTLGGLDSLDNQSKVLQKGEDANEEVIEEKMSLEIKNDFEQIAKNSPLHDEDKVTEFIDHWNEMKRLFRELVERDLYKKRETDLNENLSIQDAIFTVLLYLEDNGLIRPRGLIRKKLKFHDGLARFISEYFIDTKTDFYLRCKFRTPRINDDTLGFIEWRKELVKTPKQPKEDKKLFLEQCREDKNVGVNNREKKNLKKKDRKKIKK